MHGSERNKSFFPWEILLVKLKLQKLTKEDPSVNFLNACSSIVDVNQIAQLVSHLGLKSPSRGGMFKRRDILCSNGAKKKNFFNSFALSKVNEKSR